MYTVRILKNGSRNERGTFYIIRRESSFLIDEEREKASVDDPKS
jgi:hypothetical protein